MMLPMQAQVPFVCQSQYYLSLTKGNNPSSDLYEVKFSQNGTSVILQDISPDLGLLVNAMGYRVTENIIYGMDPFTARLRKFGSDGIARDLGIPLGIPRDQLYYAGDVTPDGRYLLVIGIGSFFPRMVRIDLDSPVYQTTIVPLQNINVAMVDVAFDPFSGVLYGYDMVGKSLITINPTTGAVNNSFTRQPLVQQLGAMFFDSFGNLFGYGSYGSDDQNKFVAIDKVSGKISLLAIGPETTGQDGCSCPYTLGLQKTVQPDTALPCTEVVFSFVISNGSGASRSGISLSDVMPSDLKVKSIVTNPFGGQSVINNNRFDITNMVVPTGIDTIKVLVEVGSNALGLYKNQAILTGLPLSLGLTTKSDNPATFIEKDSTSLFIEPFDISFINEEYIICPSDSLLIDATLHGIKYLWSDGDTSSKKWLKAPAKYTLQVRSLCESKLVTIEVKSDFFSVDVIPENIEIDLGEFIDLTATYESTSEGVTFLWTAINNPEVDCTSCINTTSRPFNDGMYILTMTSKAGCTVSDSVYIKVNKERPIYTPNIITTYSESNDRFFLHGKSNIAKGINLKIFDRWGNNVYVSENFELNDPSFGWDGTISGTPAISGVYTWISEIIYIDDFRQIVTGDVTVIR